MFPFLSLSSQKWFTCLFTPSYIHLSHSATLSPQSYYSKFWIGGSIREHYTVQIREQGAKSWVTFCHQASGRTHLCDKHLKSQQITIPCILRYFIKKEKLQAKILLYIYTSGTISRIWLISYKLYYCTFRNNLFCFKLILATLKWWLSSSSICCRKKLFAHSFCDFFFLWGMFSRTTSLKKTD